MEKADKVQPPEVKVPSTENCDAAESKARNELFSALESLAATPEVEEGLARFASFKNINEDDLKLRVR
jgi:hypothetical protein